MIKKKFLILITFFATIPQFVFAQLNGSNAEGLFISAHSLIKDRLIPLFIALALVYTIYSVFQFMVAVDDTQQREEKKQQIFWGIIGLFVITSIWGLVSVIGDTFGLVSQGNLIGK